MLGFLGALPHETSRLRRGMREVDKRRISSCRLVQGCYRGETVVVATSGMGRILAEQAAQLMLDRYPISLLVSIGYAGALTEALDIGDVVLGSRLDAHDDSLQNEPYVADKTTLTAITNSLNRSGVGFHCVPGISVTDLVCQPEQRASLSEQFGAQFADMESYWLSHVAQARGVSFVTLRTISDTKDRPLLPFSQMMTPDGRWKGKQTAKHFLRHPQHMARVLRLVADVHRARKQLDRAVRGLVDGLRQGDYA